MIYEQIIESSGANHDLEAAFSEVFANIQDVNTDPTKVREVRVVFKLKPDKHRNLTAVAAVVSAKKAAADPGICNIVIGTDHRTGEVKAEVLGVGLEHDRHVLPLVEEREDAPAEENSKVTAMRRSS